MVKKKPKAKTKAKTKISMHASVKKLNRMFAAPESNGAPVVVAVTPPVQPPSFRDMKREMEGEIYAFRDYVVEKYSSFHGYDLRKDAAWFLEQMGIGIASDIERAKREERQKLIAENQAKEASEKLAKEAAEKLAAGK